MVNREIFECIIKNTLLISIDFLVKKDDKYLLGKRRNRPAKDFYFTIGGRIFKNESIEYARERILKEELNIKNVNEFKFLGIFEHFYKDSIFGSEISTHYINLAYEIEINEIKITDLKNLPKKQHSEYKWFKKEEILKSNEVHKYVKDYFKGSRYV